MCACASHRCRRACMHRGLGPWGCRRTIASRRTSFVLAVSKALRLIFRASPRWRVHGRGPAVRRPRLREATSQLTTPADYQQTQGRASRHFRLAIAGCAIGGRSHLLLFVSTEGQCLALRNRSATDQWTHWGLNPGPSACAADVIPLHHVPLSQIATSKRPS